MHWATINLHELNISFHAAPAMSGATATRATGCSWRRSSGSSAPVRPGAIFPMGRKRRLGESIEDLSGRSGQRVRHDRCNRRQSPPAQRRGSKKGDSKEAIGRSRGGLTTKIHAIVDALGNPLAVSLTGGDVHDVTQAQLLSQKIEPAALLADEGYDTGGFIEHLFKSAASSPSFGRGQIARRRASATSRSIASATSWNVSSTSSSTFAPWQPATRRLPETSSQASTSSAPWLGSNDDRP